MSLQFHREQSQGYSILRYGSGEIRLRSHPDGQEHRLVASAILLPDRLIDDWRPQQLDELCSEDFRLLAELAPEVVLFGSGATIAFPPAEHFRLLSERGIGVEVMDTRAACRTFNVLANEGRHVAAALLMI